MVRPNGESAPWMVLANSRWVMPCGLSFCRAMLLVTAVSAIFRRSGSKAGLRSTSAKASMIAGASAFSALIDADAESALMPLSIDAARASRNSSSASGLRVVVPPLRSTVPTRPASPTFSAGSSSDPVRMRAVTLTSGSSWSSMTITTRPFGSTKRVGFGAWNAGSGG